MADRLDDESQETGRAQVGVSTLIIFIAAVLVAAATAGVLFQTVDLLESRSADAGNRVADEVGGDVSVVAVTGSVNETTTPATVDSVRVILSGGGNRAGNGVDMRDAQIQVRTPAGQSVLSYSDAGPTRETTFGVDVLSDSDGSAPLLNDDDRFAVVVDTGTLDPGDRFTGTLMVESGATKMVRVTVPQDVGEQSAVVLR